MVTHLLESTLGAIDLICGPTLGCGKATPFTQAKDGSWHSPATCLHCGQAFAGPFVLGGPHAVVQAFPAAPLVFAPGHTPLAVTAAAPTMWSTIPHRVVNAVEKL
jgi:hypothetical protein